MCIHSHRLHERVFFQHDSKCKFEKKKKKKKENLERIYGPGLTWACYDLRRSSRSLQVKKFVEGFIDWVD